jgi:hypothetical protein
MNVDEIIDKLSYYGPGATFAGIELAQLRDILLQQQEEIAQLKTLNKSITDDPLQFMRIKSVEK